MVFALVIPYSSLAFGQDSGALDSVMAGQNGVVLTLSTAVSVALDANPTLAEIKARYQAAEAVPSQRGALPDPALSFQLMNFPTDTFRFNQEPMTQVSFGISQGIPYPGKRKLRTEAAAFEAEAVAAEVEETQLRLVRDVKGQWWELFYLDRALETVGSNLELMRDLVKNAESKYEQGQGLQADVLLAQVELSTLLDQLISLRGMRKGKEAALNALLNRPTNQPIALTKTVGEVFPDIEPEQGLLAMAEESRPILEAQRLRIEAAESRRDLALKDYYPDFQLRASYGFRGGVNPLNGIDRPDFASAGVTISLPIYTGPKQDKAHQQRVAEVYQSRMALDRQRAIVQEQISRTVSDYGQAVEQAGLFRTGIIPQARQSLEATRAAYLVNKVDFLNLVRAQINLYNFETQYWRAATRAYQALASLEAAVGEDVNDG
ncbi:MAG: TolC family protein [Rhodospirillaceae bacterium]